MSDMLQDKIETVGHSSIQHGPSSNRVYLMKLDRSDVPRVIMDIEELAIKNGYTKLFAKVSESARDSFVSEGYRLEAAIPGFYRGEEDAFFLGKYLDEDRTKVVDRNTLSDILVLAKARGEAKVELGALPTGMSIVPCGPEHAVEMSQVYREVFPTYPFPIHDPGYLRDTMSSHVDYFAVVRLGQIIALSSAEMDSQGQNVEMTDFATLPDHLGQGLAAYLLEFMEHAMNEREMITAYTIARAVSPGMNITFAKMGYIFGGLLVNNTQISGSIESMNVWYKKLR